MGFDRCPNRKEIMVIQMGVEIYSHLLYLSNQLLYYMKSLFSTVAMAAMHHGLQTQIKEKEDRLSILYLEMKKEERELKQLLKDASAIGEEFERKEDVKKILKNAKADIEQMFENEANKAKEEVKTPIVVHLDKEVINPIIQVKDLDGLKRHIAEKSKYGHWIFEILEGYDGPVAKERIADDVNKKGNFREELKHFDSMLGNALLSAARKGALVQFTKKGVPGKWYQTVEWATPANITKHHLKVIDVNRNLHPQVRPEKKKKEASV
jgi:hypothetical protein